jgi:hypothetical protein
VFVSYELRVCQLGWKIQENQPLAKFLKF